MASRIFESLGRLFSGGDPARSKALAGIANRAGRRGTPPYMAPELWTADGRQTAATDIYAYGVMLAELVTGKVPLLAPKDDLRRWARAHAEGSPRIDLDPNRPDREAAQTLRALALRCIAKAPGDRPPDFSTLAKEVIAAAFEHVPMLAESPRRASHERRDGMVARGRRREGARLLRSIPRRESGA